MPRSSLSCIEAWELVLYVTSKMADAMERNAICEEFCVICATVTVGLERICAGECERKLRCRVRQGRGRIYFNMRREDISKIKELRSVENLFVVVAELENFDCLATEPVQDILKKFYHLPKEVKWDAALALWKEFTGCQVDTGTKESCDQFSDVTSDEIENREMLAKCLGRGCHLATFLVSNKYLFLIEYINISD